MGTIRTIRRRRWLLAVIAGVLLAGLVGGAAVALAETSSPSASASKIIIRFGYTNESANMNPFLGYESSDTEIQHLNYDLLVGYDAKTLEPTPELAESWSHDETGTVWTFKLRQGVKWTDGEPFTAADVVWTYNFILQDPENNYFGSYVTYFTEVKALDDYTVQITTSQPKATMLRLWIPILPEHIWSKIPAEKINSDYPNTIPVVGTGPFQVVEWKKGSYVRLAANKDYWRATPKVDEVIFQTYTSQDTMVQDIKSGNLDAAWNLPQAQFSSVADTPGITAIKYVAKGFTEVGFNCCPLKTSKGNPVLVDWKFRQALNWAVDKDKIISVAYNGFGNPATSLVQSNYFKNPDYHWEPPADVKYTYDPEKAKAALDAAGYTDTNGDGIRDYKGKPIELRLWARSESPTSQTAGKMITDWLKAVGLKIKLEIMDDNYLNDQIYATVGADETPAPDYDMFIWSWGGDPDPDFILNVLNTSQWEGWSDTFYSNAEYDDLYKQQQVALDTNARKAIIDKMQEIVYRESPYIILAYDLETEAYNTDKWTGWVRSPDPDGPVWYAADNIDTYIFVGLKTERATSEGGGLSGGAIAGIVVAAVIVVGGGLWLILRRRGKEKTEEI